MGDIEFRYFKIIGLWSGLSGTCTALVIEFRRIYESAVSPLSTHQFLKLLAIAETVTLVLFALATLTIFVRRRFD